MAAVNLPKPTIAVDEVVLAGDSIALQASTTGNNPNLSYVWRIVDAPKGSNPILSSFTMVGPMLTTDRVGIYILEVFATDGGRISESAFAEITAVASIGENILTSRSFTTLALCSFFYTVLNMQTACTPNTVTFNVDSSKIDNDFYLEITGNNIATAFMTLNGMKLTNHYDFTLGVNEKIYKKISLEENNTLSIDQRGDFGSSIGIRIISSQIPTVTNQKPTLSASAITVGQDSRQATTTLVYSDPDMSQGRTFQILENPSHGIASVNDNGVVTYTVKEGYKGLDSFVLAVYDNGLHPKAKAIRVPVDSRYNSPPRLVAFQDFMSEPNEKLYFTLKQAVDSEDNDIRYTLVDAISSGTLSDCLENLSSINLECLFTPDEDFIGTTTFFYKANDGKIDSLNKAEVDLNIYPQGPPMIQITLGTYSSCALDQYKGVQCWGQREFLKNSYGPNFTNDTSTDIEMMEYSRR